jgi:PAS domain S-box-containing protein
VLAPRRGAPSWKPRVGRRAVAIVLTATAFPVVSLLWASGVARAEVEHRALGGLAATGKATVLQEQQAWDDAVLVVMSGVSRPGLLRDLDSHNSAALLQIARNILITGPFANVRVYDASGTLAAMAGLPGTTPTDVSELGTGRVTLGNPVTTGTKTSRQLAAAIGGAGPRLGALVVDVDLTQLLGKPSNLAFGRTGVKFLVTRPGMVVAGSAAVGTVLRGRVNLDIAASGKPATKLFNSPFYGRLTVEAYEPIPGQNMGILVQQARSEVMGGADHLTALLRWVALGVALLGAAFAASLGAFLNRRSRRLAISEQQLAYSQSDARRRLEQFLDAMPIGVFVTTSDGRPHYANREAERLLGRGIVPGAAPEDLAEVYRAYLAGTDELYPSANMPLVRALRGETSHADDIEIRRADATVPVEVWGTPILAGDNAVEFAITAFADASERRRAAEEVKFLSSITASMSEGVVLVRSQDARIVYANNSFETMFGYGPGELVGCSAEKLTPPGVAAIQEDSTSLESLLTQGAWHGEVENVRKDGTTFWSAVAVTALDQSKFGPAWIAVNTDITARKHSQDAQARLASIVQASREAILGETLDGVVTSWNREAQTLFGYPAPEIIGCAIEVLVPPEGRDEEASLRGRVARGLRVEPYETVLIRRDGRPVHVSATMSPIEDAAGGIVGIATICRDITERKRVEAVLLEREEQLADARDQALEASRLKSQPS